MNIGVAYENGRIAKNLGDCREVLIITTEGREPVGKRIAGIAGTSATDLIKFAGLEQIDVLICGSLGLATRNALEMLGVLLVPGCEGSAVTRPSSRSAVRKIRMIRWHACTTVQSAPAAARASCSSRFRSRRSSKKHKNHRFSVVFMFLMEN